MTSDIKTGNFFIDSYGFETTYGTAVTVDEPMGIHQNTTLTVKNNFTRYYGGSGIRDPSHLIKGKKEVRGTTSMIIQNGKILQSFWGAADTSGSSPYTHVLDAFDGSGDEKDVRSMTMDLSAMARGSGSNEVYTADGIMINTFRLSFAEEAELKFDFDWIAQDITSAGTITSVSRDTDKPYMFYQGVVVVDGVTIATIERGTFTANNNLLPYYPVSSNRVTAEPILLQRAYDLSLSFKMISSVHFDKLLTASDTGVTVTATFTRGADDTLTLTCSNTVYEQDDLTFPNTDAVIEDLSMIPKSAYITIVDSISSYT